MNFRGGGGGGHGGGHGGGRGGRTRGASGAPTLHLPDAMYPMFKPRDKLEILPPPHKPGFGEDDVKRRLAGQKALLVPEDGKESDKGSQVDELDKDQGQLQVPVPATVSQVAPKDLFTKKIELVGRCPPGLYPFPRKYLLDEVESSKKKAERQQRRAEKRQKIKNDVIARSSTYDPNADPEGKKTSNAYNSLFVGNLKRKQATKDILQKHFEQGGCKVIKVVLFPKQGYAFVEFADADDMKKAYKRDGVGRLDGNRIVVDVERARTVKDWRPKALGGGHSSRDRDRDRGRSDRDKDRDRGGSWTNKRGRDDYRDRWGGGGGGARDRGGWGGTHRHDSGDSKRRRR